MIILTRMLVLFVLMLMGVIAYKKGMLNEAANKSLAAIVVNISNPALILSSVVGDYERAPISMLILTVTVAVGMYVVLIPTSYVFLKLIRAKDKDKDIYGLMTIFSNIGFMGFPIITAVFGREALLYASIFLLPYNLLVYTYGIQKMSGSKEKGKIQWKQLMNIGVIASIVTITLFSTQMQINGWIGDSIVMLSELTAPLSMMLIGASLAQSNLREMAQDKRLIVFSLMKQLLIPLIIGWVVLQVVPDPTVAGITVIMLATPVGSMCAMLAKTYNSNDELVSKGVVLTTLLSFGTIPLVVNLLLGGSVS